MSVSQLPNGRWRAQVYDPATGKSVAVAKILGREFRSFKTPRQAERAREKARARLDELRRSDGMTVGEWADIWKTDPLYRRPKASTNAHNSERIRRFVEQHRDLPLTQVSDMVVAKWIRGGKNRGTVPALRAMFSDAASADAGRLIDRNPFAGLKLGRSRGNRDVTPPTEEEIWALIGAARRVATPSFAAWLQTAAFTGMRPGELDALLLERVDLAANRIHVVEQWSATTREFTPPKNGQARIAPLPPPARDAIVALGREPGVPWAFANTRNRHWTPGARAYYWKAVRAVTGETRSLYLCTRHFAGSHMVNVLELPSEDVAIALGHTDGGDLVRRLYGHRDKDLALARVQRAFEATANVVSLSLVKEAESA